MFGPVPIGRGATKHPAPRYDPSAASRVHAKAHEMPHLLECAAWRIPRLGRPARRLKVRPAPNGVGSADPIPVGPAPTTGRPAGLSRCLLRPPETCPATTTPSARRRTQTTRRRCPRAVYRAETAYPIDQQLGLQPPVSWKPSTRPLPAAERHTHEECSSSRNPAIARSESNPAARSPQPAQLCFALRRWHAPHTSCEPRVGW